MYFSRPKLLIKRMVAASGWPLTIGMGRNTVWWPSREIRTGMSRMSLISREMIRKLMNLSRPHFPALSSGGGNNKPLEVFGKIQWDNTAETPIVYNGYVDLQLDWAMGYPEIWSNVILGVCESVPTWGQHWTQWSEASRPPSLICRGPIQSKGFLHKIERLTLPQVQRSLPSLRALSWDLLLPLESDCITSSSRILSLLAFKPEVHHLLSWVSILRLLSLHNHVSPFLITNLFIYIKRYIYIILYVYYIQHI